MNAQVQTQEFGTLLDEPSLLERVSALRRRAKPMLIAFLGVLAVCVAVAFLWPATYRSSGTVLIEQQEVPQDFVRAAVTSFAEQRVRVISARVMTTTNLLQIIKDYDLYPKQRKTEPREKLLDRMRDDIGLEMISADVVDPQQGRATKATIAFTVSFDSRSAEQAAKVANELTTLYLNENLETRKRMAGDTAAFLQEEAERVGREVAGLEQKIADFKSRNGDSLPELSQVNIQLVTRAQEEIRSVESRITALDQQLVFRDSQLVQISPVATSYSETGERVMSTSDRLKSLRTQLASAAAVYGPEHPTVVRLKREVAGLEAEVGAADEGNELVRQLEDAKSKLASARNRYSPEHPDVVRLEKVVAAIEEAMK